MAFKIAVIEKTSKYTSEAFSIAAILTFIIELLCKSNWYTINNQYRASYRIPLFGAVLPMLRSC